jgi:hypothetical protein
VTGLLGCLLAGACEQPAQQRPDAPASDSEARDTATHDATRLDTAAPPLTPGGAVTVPRAEAHHFDTGALAVGDTFLGLRVVRSDVRRVFEDSVWIGNVAFDGPIEVAGVFQQHFDYPEIDQLCAAGVTGGTMGEGVAPAETGGRPGVRLNAWMDRCHSEITMEAKRKPRHELHQLIDALPEEETHAARRYLEYLARHGDPFLRAIHNAPEIDESLSEEDRQALDEGRRALGEGDVVSDKELRAELGI